MIDSEAIRRAARDLRLVQYSEDAVEFHLIVDDWNLDGDNILRLRPRTPVGSRLRHALVRMTVAERASAQALEEGFWGVGTISFDEVEERIRYASVMDALLRAKNSGRWPFL